MAAWRVAEGMFGGLTIKTIMWEICNTAIQWKEYQQKAKEKHPKK